MFGYAKDADSNQQNTQKFNCHKLSEFEVGLHSRTEGLSNSNIPKLLKMMTDKKAKSTQEMLWKVEFYSELL